MPGDDFACRCCLKYHAPPFFRSGLGDRSKLPKGGFSLVTLR